MQITAKTTTVASQAVGKPFISRWSIPVAGLLLTLMGGISYAWGVFVVPLQERFGWSRAEAMLPLSIHLMVFTTVGMIYGGILQDRFGPRKVPAAGGVLFLIAYLMMMQIHRFPYTWWLVLTYGIVGGLANGLAYCAAIPAARKWFPDKTALAVAMSVTGFGLAATIFAPWITRLIRTVGIEQTFLTVGIVVFVFIMIGAWVMRLPPQGWVPPGWEGIQPGTSAAMYAPRTEATLGEAIRSPLFHTMWIGYFCIIFAGLMAMAHVVPYGISILGMERPAAALAAVFFGLANGFGRPLAGLIAEKTGPMKVMFVVYAVAGVTFLLFNTIARTPVTLYISAFIFGCLFATTLGLLPVLTTVGFGVKNLGAIYGALKTAFGLAAFFGPMAAAWAYDVTGTYVVPFTGAGVLVLVGLAIYVFGLRIKYKMP